MEISFPGGKKVDAKYEGFIIKTDQPKKEGGDGSAPEPFSFFISSIGTCTGVYILSFCQERNIPTNNLKMILKTVKNKETKMIDKIFMDIKVPKSFPDIYKKTLLKVAGLCTVKKHLEKPPKIDISVN
jgi:ribosomal protein S12 methylthiotransferase accessory factor